MQFLVKSYCHTPWLLALLTTALLPPSLALPLSFSLGRRLSTTSPKFDFSDLSITDAFGPTGTAVFGSLTSPTGKHVNYAVSLPDGMPVLATANMFSSWQQPVGPSSIMETLRTALNRLIVSAEFHLGLPTPLAFLVGFTVMFLFVLSSLFGVFLLWHVARKAVGRRGAWRGPLGREKMKTITNNGREFVIRSRPVTRITLRPSPKMGILSPASSRSSSSGSESPCPKRVRWVDEERGCPICAESCRVVDGDFLGCGIDVEMEKVD